MSSTHPNDAGLSALPPERDSLAPLAVGLAVAIFLHAAMIGGVEAIQRTGFFGFASSRRAADKDGTDRAAEKGLNALPPRAANANDTEALARLLAQPARVASPVIAHAAPKEKQIKFGKDEGDPLSIAWVGYDDFQEMIAPKGNVEQPALQKDAEPIAGAPIRPDPTPSRPAVAAAAPMRGSPGAAPRAAVPVAPPAPSAAAVKPAVAAAMPKPVQASATPPVVSPPVVPVKVNAKPAEVKLVEKPAETPQETPRDPLVATSVKAQSGELPPVGVKTTPVPRVPQEAPKATPATKLPEEAPKTEQLAMAAPTPPLVTEAPTLTVKPAPPGEKPGEAEKPQPEKAAAPAPPTSQPAGGSTPSPGREATPSSPGSPGSPGIPGIATGAPRSDRESAPVSLTGTTAVNVRPGRVIAGEGIEIKTVHPRFSAVALSSSVPKNPVVKVVFNKQGTVINADIVKTSEYPNIDGPIVASLYQWKATGKKLAELNRSFEVTIHIILLDEDDGVEE